MPNTRAVKAAPMVDLFSYLGYEKDLFSKQYTALDQQISTFFKNYVACKGPLKHSWISKSTEMDLCAAKFLNEDGCGEVFWHRSLESKLEWPRDQEKITKKISEIFRKKANYLYIKEHQARREQKAKAMSPKSAIQKKQNAPIICYNSDTLQCNPPLISEHTENDGDSDYQPERLLLGTVCLDQDYSIKPYIERSKDSAITACIRYVQTLNPCYIKDLTVFTKKWLISEEATWPESADSQLELLMHNRKFYIALDDGEQIDPGIMHSLARGTELADLEDGLQINKFLKRIRERITHLTQKLINELYLNWDLDGTAVQSKTFEAIWRQKRLYFQAAVKDAASERLDDDTPRKRCRAWKLRGDEAQNELDGLLQPKRRRQPQKLRAKPPISPEFSNLGLKSTVTSGSKFTSIAVTALGLTYPSSGEEVGGAFVAPPANYNLLRLSSPEFAQGATAPHISSTREASVGDSIEVDPRPECWTSVSSMRRDVQVPWKDDNIQKSRIIFSGNSMVLTNQKASSSLPTIRNSQLPSSLLSPQVPTLDNNKISLTPAMSINGLNEPRPQNCKHSSTTVLSSSTEQRSQVSHQTRLILALKVPSHQRSSLLSRVLSPMPNIDDSPNDHTLETSGNGSKPKDNSSSKLITPSIYTGIPNNNAKANLCRMDSYPFARVGSSTQQPRRTKAPSMLLPRDLNELEIPRSSWELGTRPNPQSVDDREKMESVPTLTSPDTDMSSVESPSTAHNIWDAQIPTNTLHIPRCSPAKVGDMLKGVGGVIERGGNDNSSSPNPAKKTNEPNPGINASRLVESGGSTSALPDISRDQHVINPTTKASSPTTTVTLPRCESFYSAIGSQVKYSTLPTLAERSLIRFTARESTTPILALQIQDKDGNIDLEAYYLWEDHVENSSLEHFFQFAAEISKTEHYCLSELKFLLNFGRKPPLFEVKRYDYRIWKNIKKIVPGLFRLAQRDSPQEMEFLITVITS